jgi:nucleoside-diphosphate-sugar epimerase
MRVVLTGGSGFVGRAALAPLLATGAEVHLLGRSGAVVPGCQSHAIDLVSDDPASVLAAIAPTHLLHCAWYAEPGKFWHAPQNLDWLAASLRLARGFAAAGGTRLVGTGSCAEYDWAGSLMDEATTPLAPATLYGTAKAALFQTLMTAAPALGISFGWGRIFFPYGRGERSGRLLPDVIDAVLAGRRVATSDGGQTRDFIHVDDAAAAMVALLASDITGAVNIASGDCLPLRDIIGMAAAQAGDAGLIDWGTRPRQPGEPEVMAAATARLHGTLGFVPRWTLADGIADMVAARRLP